MHLAGTKQSGCPWARAAEAGGGPCLANALCLGCYIVFAHGTGQDLSSSAQGQGISPTDASPLPGARHSLGCASWPWLCACPAEYVTASAISCSCGGRSAAATHWKFKPPLARHFSRSGLALLPDGELLALISFRGASCDMHLATVHRRSDRLTKFPVSCEVAAARAEVVWGVNRSARLQYDGLSSLPAQLFSLVPGE